MPQLNQQLLLDKAKIAIITTNKVLHQCTIMTAMYVKLELDLHHYVFQMTINMWCFTFMTYRKQYMDKIELEFTNHAYILQRICRSIASLPRV